MTTPAVNRNEAPTVEYPRYLMGSINGYQHLKPTWDCLIRPESRTSPIRADGTRAPMSWDTRWGRMQLAIRNRTWPFYGGYSFESDTPCTSYESIVEQLRNGASWAAGAAGGFPYSIESEARTRVLLKLIANQCQLGVAAGELRQTAGLVEKLATDTTKAINRIGRGVQRAPDKIIEFLVSPYAVGRKQKRDHQQPPSGWKRREAESVIDNWMEYQFGIKPLVHDIQDVGQALSDSLFVDKVPLVTRYRAGCKEELLQEWETAYGAQGIPCTLSGTAEISSECHISALYEVPVSTGRTLDQLGLGNPAAVAWELTQASWLVDYAIGMGDWLQSLTADNHGSLREGSLSRKTVVKLSPQAVPKRLNVGSTGFGPEPLYGEWGRFQRQVLHLLLPAYTPPIRGKLGLTQTANAVSYLTQALKGIPPHLRT